MKRGSVSATCASLYILALLEIAQVTCGITDIVLNMAPTAFDDQYIGCEEKMAEKMLSTHLLEAEKAMNLMFRYSWDTSSSEWRRRVEEKKLPPLPKGFKDKHGIALLVYTDSDIYMDFNAAVRGGGASPEYYMQSFHFKVLHFYLTTGLKLLRGSCKETCQTVYRGVTGIHFYPPSTQDKKLRFGQFTSTSTSKERAEGFGEDSFFTLMTCFGVCIQNFSGFPAEDEVLMPVNEVFTCSTFDPESHAFVLDSTKQTCSKYNCTYLGGLNLRVGSAYPYCVSSAAGNVAFLSGKMTPQFFAGVLIMISVVTPRLLSGY
ncbi:ecto-ADP-ribosyltransferase 5-like isoform X1 [Rhinatrema bivittatum]|uniref:ecto-ADP-ribosyltransferase 5-like isoform X1 n=1 Tax=Rhinatrema bivittatum TaxID=194408 RepID=UPI0011299892|nr:ecto-ADP-ribosyltransferase 5-like isoform X1 [Rhinatrema bivittatum]